MKISLRFLFIFIIFYDFCLGSPVSKNGVIDLNSWDIEKEEKIDLYGDWHFYWKQFIRPESVADGVLPSNPLSIKMPGEWSGAIKDPNNPGKKFDLGYGTYILTVKGFKAKSKLAFFIRYFATAYSFYIIQGDKIIPVVKTGGVGKSKEMSRHR